MIEKVRAIPDHSNEITSDGKLPMLFLADEIPEIIINDSSRFEVIDAVVQSSRWFHSIKAQHLEAERNALLDKFLFANGYIPVTLQPLTSVEIEKATDALSRLILLELGALNAQAMLTGARSIEEFGLAVALEATYIEVAGPRIRILPDSKVASRVSARPKAISELPMV